MLPASFLASSSLGNRMCHNALDLLLKTFGPIWRLHGVPTNSKSHRVSTSVVKEIARVVIASRLSGMVSIGRIFFLEFYVVLCLLFIGLVTAHADTRGGVDSGYWKTTPLCWGSLTRSYNKIGKHRKDCATVRGRETKMDFSLVVTKWTLPNRQNPIHLERISIGNGYYCFYTIIVAQGRNGSGERLVITDYPNPS